MHILAEVTEITSIGKFINVLIFIYVVIGTPVMIGYAMSFNKRKLDGKPEEKESKGKKSKS